MASKTKYTFVDLENVHPDKLLIAANEKVFVFVGTGQKSIKKELVIPLQKLGGRAEYIAITGTGKNALDFHIAFYMGEIVAKDPDCELCIISNDTGYDPLIAHLKERYKIKAARKAGKAKAVKKTKAAATTTTKTTKKTNATISIIETNERMNKVILALKKSNTNKPRTVVTLINRIKNVSGLTNLNNNEAKQIIEELEVRGHIEIQDTGRIEFKLPKTLNPAHSYK